MKRKLLLGGTIAMISIVTIGAVTSVITPTDHVRLLPRDALVVPVSLTLPVKGSAVLLVDGDAAIHGTLDADSALEIRVGGDLLVTGTIRGGSGPVTLRAEGDIVLDGLVVGGTGPLTISSGNDIEVNGNVIGKSGDAPGASGQSVDVLADHSLLVAGSVVGGHGAPGANRVATGSATGSPEARVVMSRFLVMILCDWERRPA